MTSFCAKPTFIFSKKAKKEGIKQSKSAIITKKIDFRILIFATKKPVCRKKDC